MLCRSLFPVYADNIPIEGEWDTGKPPRSLIPMKPTASLEGNIITIGFSDALLDLIVTVSDNSGLVCFQETISSESNSIYQLPYSLQEGEYTLSLTHRYGSLIGFFEVE